MTEEDLTWDLTELFTSCDDPEISKTIDTLMGIADDIIKNYKGKINIPSFTAQNLHDLLENYEDMDISSTKGRLNHF
jgi:hypothetical protein